MLGGVRGCEGVLGELIWTWDVQVRNTKAGG